MSGSVRSRVDGNCFVVFVYGYGSMDFFVVFVSNFELTSNGIFRFGSRYVSMELFVRFGSYCVLKEFILSSSDRVTVWWILFASFYSSCLEMEFSSSGPVACQLKVFCFVRIELRFDGIFLCVWIVFKWFF